MKRIKKQNAFNARNAKNAKRIAMSDLNNEFTYVINDSDLDPIFRKLVKDQIRKQIDFEITLQVNYKIISK